MNVVKSAQAQIGDLIHHMEQMKGMFSDADGAIQKAIDDARAWNGLDWKIITDLENQSVSDLTNWWVNVDYEIYVLYDDGSEALIESFGELAQAISKGQQVAREPA